MLSLRTRLNWFCMETAKNNGQTVELEHFIFTRERYRHIYPASPFKSGQTIIIIKESIRFLI